MTDLFYDQRYAHTRMVNPDFIALAKSMRVHAIRVHSAEELPAKMKEFLEYPEDKPVLMECLVSTSEHVFPMVRSELLATAFLCSPPTCCRSLQERLSTSSSCTRSSATHTPRRRRRPNSSPLPTLLDLRLLLAHSLLFLLLIPEFVSSLLCAVGLWSHTACIIPCFAVALLRGFIEAKRPAADDVYQNCSAYPVHIPYTSSWL